MSDTNPARTMFASKAIELHTLFAVKFKDTKVGSKLPRRVLVQEIDVESTHGGQQAKMSITLVPENQQGPKLVCGWIDAANNRVRMRSHNTLAAMFKAQAGHFFDVPPAEYQEFLQQVEDFVKNNEFHFEVYDEASKYQTQGPAAKAPKAAQGNAVMIVGAILLVAVGVAVAILMLS